MRRLIWLLAFAIVLGVVLFSAAALLLRPDRLRAPLQATLSGRLGRAVEIGKMELALWPIPRVRVRSLRIEGDGGADGAAPLLQADEILLRPALLPLLVGQVVIRTLEIDAPRLTLAVDDRGLPVTPRLEPVPGSTPAESHGPAAGEGAPGEERSAEAKATDERAEPGSGASLAIQSILVHRGSLTAGAWQVEGLEATGALHLDGSARIELSATLPELGQLSRLEVELTGLGHGPPKIAVRGKLKELDPGLLARRLGIPLELQAKATGSFDLEIDHGTVQAGGTDLALSVGEFKSGELELVGPIPLQARLGDSFALDLDGVALRVGESLHKRPGETLKLSGPLPRALPPQRLEGLTLEIGDSKIPLALQLEPLSLELGAARVSLPALRAWLPAMLSDLEGSLEIETLHVTPEPLGIVGQATLNGVSVEVERGRARVSGPLKGLGTRLQAGPLQLQLADQRTTANVDYRIDTGDFDVTLGTAQTQLGAWVAALLGRDGTEGTLDLHATLKDALSAPMRKLRGYGSIEIAQGRIQGFSIAREALGAFAALPMLVSRLRDRDPSRYLDERFDRLSARWTIRDGFISTDDLVIVQRDSRLELAGRVGLWDGELDLRGRLVIGSKLDAALAGETRGRQKVIPIAGIAGTIGRPRVRLDRAAVAHVAATYLATDRLQKQLEDRLGPGGAEAVQGVLDRLLGGRRKAQ